MATRVLNPGLNGENIVVIGHDVAEAVTSGNSLAITLPDGVSKDLVPIAVVAYSDATPAVEGISAGANAKITSHNRTTGVTTLTAASSGIAKDARLVLLYVPCPKAPPAS